MVDQVQSPRVEQPQASLINSVRATVVGSTGLSTGQTATAVVQSADTSVSTTTAQTAGRSSMASSTPQQLAITQTASHQITAAGSTATPPAQSTTQQVTPQLQAQPQQASTTPPTAQQSQPAQIQPQPSQGNSQAAVTTQIQTPAPSSMPSTAATQTPAPAAALTAEQITQLQSAVKVQINTTGLTVALPQLKSLPLGTQILLRQQPGQLVDILNIRLPNQATASAKSVLGNNLTTLTPTASSINNIKPNLITTELQPSLPQGNKLQDQAAQIAKLQDALRTSLPQQQPTAEVLSKIQQQISQNPNINRILTSELQQALNTLDQAKLKLNPNQTPNIAELKQAIQKSGVLHEAMLLQGLSQITATTLNPLTVIPDDLKSAFFQIFRHLARQGKDGNKDNAGESNKNNSENSKAESQKQQVDQLQKTIQEGIAKIRSNQLHSALLQKGADGAPAATLQTVIPILFNQQLSDLQISISKEPEKKGGEQEPNRKSWVINLTFTPKQLGKLHIRLKYQEEQLSTQIWVEQDEQLPIVSYHLSRLKAKLSALGLTLDEVRCFSGKPETNPPVALLNVNA
ncbi:hook-length control protein FliK [Oceanospirillum multiglobuliferum]|uniref:Flagellar hook-length control protein-like C-terminal domain-containing protein n=1 Tax=Oceanospirillum multiglobuliferum TaxID=64969 RepID=A0A1T4L604_9GAMM|nr:flagellar hook-length control protein FliK [Oceanospirillum multiglobuliferum]OPX56787.1 hypothetical protein BTE48_02620 [Oceanospirillum multiglobuliferum]SJZ50023.1 hook-length control protein FliK [Oceanospirillum multiglobuliferum]